MRRKIFINFIIVLLVSTLITGVLLLNFIKASYRDTKQEKLLTNINLISNILNKIEDEWDDINFHRLSQELSYLVNSRVTFIENNGQVIADSMNNSIIFDSFQLTPEYKHAIKNKIQLVQRYSREVGKDYFYLAVYPIRVGNYHIMVRLGDPYKEMDYVIDNFVNYGTLYIAVGLISAILLGYVMAGRITKPLKELTEASKQIAQGDLKKRVRAQGKDEIKELSLSFNTMASKLEITIEELKDKNQKMNAVLASIQDGLIALDEDDKIILINGSAKKILNIHEEIELGSNIDELIIDKKLKDEILKAKSSDHIYNNEVEIGPVDKRIIELSTSTIEEEEPVEYKIDTLLVVRDVTSIRNLENMRKEFVSNVSHELRTPLTSISGFIETLKIKELDEKNKARALDIIEFEANRLKGLINNLLKLSEMENIENVKELVDIDLGNHLLEIKGLLQPQIESKNIHMLVHIEEGLNTIKGDSNWFKLIAINLIENSIKYTEEGKTIKVSLYNHGDGIKFVVEDSGLGIPQEDLPKIFERFYRVDKSRSNNIKGSGLGLSIVNSIVKLFAGSIQVESKLGEGSKFTVYLG